jgi:RND family efflux transporter MFP subunit
VLGRASVPASEREAGSDGPRRTGPARRTSGDVGGGGTVRAVRSATIAPLISGTVAEVRVGLGSSVRAGDVLVRLSAREISARLEQSKAMSALARRDRDRATTLKEQGAMPNAQYDAAMAQWNLAEAREAEASTQAERLVLRAPFAGVISAKLTNVGDTALPGQALLILEAPTALRFEARVPEAAADRLAIGATVPVRLDGLDPELEGRVAEIQPAADDATRTRLAKLDLPEVPGLRSGRFGRLLLTTGSSSTVMVPAEAVVQQGQLETVFVVDGDVARLRLVRTGRQRGRLGGDRLRPVRG